MVLLGHHRHRDVYLFTWQRHSNSRCYSSRQHSPFSVLSLPSHGFLFFVIDGNGLAMKPREFLNKKVPLVWMEADSEKEVELRQPAGI